MLILLRTLALDPRMKVRQRKGVHAFKRVNLFSTAKIENYPTRNSELLIPISVGTAVPNILKMKN